MTSPVQVLDMRDDLVRRVALGDGLKPPPEIGRERDPEKVQCFRVAASEQLALSHLVLWDSPMLAASWNGAEQFEGRPIPGGWCQKQVGQLWIYDRLIPQAVDAIPEDVRHIYDRPPYFVGGAFWGTVKVRGERKLAYWALLVDDDFTAFLNFGGVLSDGDCFGEVNYKLAASSFFLEQEIVGLDPVPVPRGDRRRAQKAGKPEPIVKTVVLRRKQRKERDPNAQVVPVDWSCQWLVGAHWRKNFRDENKPIFVSAYVKGPEDRPFKPPSETIYRVAR